MLLFLPYGDNQPKTWISPITLGLILINTLVFVATATSPDGPAIVERFAFHPRSPGPITWLTSLFLHADIFHLLGNMLFLWVAARPLEFRLGAPRFFGLYFGGGLIASIAQTIASDRPCIGASGAIAALMGAYAIICAHGVVDLFYIVFVRIGSMEVSGRWLLAFWVAEQVVSAALLGSSQIGYAAHLGGFGAGLVAAVLATQLKLLPASRYDDANRSQPREVGAWKRRPFVPRRKSDTGAEYAAELAEARVELARTLRAGDDAATVRTYEQAQLLGGRPVLAPQAQFQLARACFAEQQQALGKHALEDLARSAPGTEEAAAARRTLHRLATRRVLLRTELRPTPSVL